MTVHQAIEAKLNAAFAPLVLMVENESHQHNVPDHSETHFKITLVSPRFSGKRQLQRHQSVYQVLADELAGPVHALALHTFSEDEWQARGVTPDSPECLGG